MIKMVAGAVVACSAIAAAGVAWADSHDGSVAWLLDEHWEWVVFGVVVAFGALCYFANRYLNNMKMAHRAELAAAQQNRRASDSDEPVLRSSFESMKAANKKEHEELDEDIKKLDSKLDKVITGLAELRAELRGAGIINGKGKE